MVFSGAGISGWLTYRTVLVVRSVVELAVVMATLFGLAVSLLVASGSRADLDLTCRDADGSPVAWYTLYKLPRLRESEEAAVQQGLGYVFVTSESAESWQFSSVDIAANDSLPGRTLAPVYSRSDRRSLMYVFYNDEHPDGPTSMTLGHTKGLVAFDGASGIWLIHSVPHYPPAPENGYGYPSSGEHYGQSFLCITLKSDQAEAVASQLLFNQPFIYASQLATDLENTYPVMAQVINKKFRNKSPWFNIAKLTTPKNGQQFLSFAKAKKFDKELYEDLVAPTLKASLLVEAWRNGPHTEQIPSDCSSAYSVQNIQNLTISALKKSGSSFHISFHNSQDHSKWAVSSSQQPTWLCIGDINRMTTQKVRGGGTVCTSHPILWSIYSNMVGAVEPCTSHALYAA